LVGELLFPVVLWDFGETVSCQLLQSKCASHTCLPPVTYLLIDQLRACPCFCHTLFSPRCQCVRMCVCVCVMSHQTGGPITPNKPAQFTLSTHSYLHFLFLFFAASVALPPPPPSLPVPELLLSFFSLSIVLCSLCEKLAFCHEFG